jgi:N-sulfoglucosamine sulfohydrolase
MSALDRRQFLKSAGIGAGALLARRAARAAEPAAGNPPRRNVVLVVSDDHGLQLGCTGDTAAHTPRLDGLAAEGTVFTQAFCTTASCSASRSVILTGLHNHRNGQFGHQHSYHDFDTHDWVKSLPVLLAAAGYRTGHIGKFHVQPEEVYHFQHRLRCGKGGTRNPYMMAENCREFLAAEDEAPFFLYFCTSDPHRAGKGFANNRGFPGAWEKEFAPDDVTVPPWLPDFPETRAGLARYYQSISRLDHGIGHLFDVLKETGHWDNTVVIYLSDHGPPWPGAKTTLYEPGMHSPLIVRSPDQPRRGIRCDGMVSWADLTPTILDIARAKGPGYDLHGRSFLPLVNKESAEGWDEVYASHTFHEVTMYYPMRVVRTRRWKYILNLAHQLPYPFASDLWASETWQATLKRNAEKYGQKRVKDYLNRPRHELYDLEADPWEGHNLANDPRHASTLADLQAKLKAWQEKTKDPWRVKYKYE